jgi:uncharacterized protein YaeQ
MALGATIYYFDISLSDLDRGVFEQIQLRVAQHPTETPDYLATRVLAYCLEWEEGIEFGKGIGDNDEPTIWKRDYGGAIKLWVEVGMPSAELLHRANKAADRVAVYTHRRLDAFMQNLSGKAIYDAHKIPIYTFDYGFIAQLTTHIDRRTAFDLSVTERQLYLNIGDFALHSAIHLHTLV